MENLRIVGIRFVFGPEKLGLGVFNKTDYWETD